MEQKIEGAAEVRQVVMSHALANPAIAAVLHQAATLSGTPSSTFLEEIVEKALAGLQASTQLSSILLVILKLIEAEIAHLTEEKPARGPVGRILHGFLKFITGRA